MGFLRQEYWTGLPIYSPQSSSQAGDRTCVSCTGRQILYLWATREWGWIGRTLSTPLQYSCQENSMDGGAWWATVYGVTKSRTRLSNFTCTFHFHALEKEMATHSSVLAWRIPGMRGAWWAAVYWVAQSRTWLKWLSSSSSIHSQAAFVWFCPTVREWDKRRVYSFFNLSRKKYTVSYRYYEL